MGPSVYRTMYHSDSMTVAEWNFPKILQQGMVVLFNYSDGGPSSNIVLYGCIILFIEDSIGSVSSSITFIDNHARLGGHAVYATPIYGCYCVKKYICETVASYFTITTLPKDLNDTQILSFPTQVQLCNCSDPDSCAMSQVSMKERIRLPHILVGLCDLMLPL